MNKLKEYMEGGFRCLFVGPPGCAKTARIHAACKEANYEMLPLRMAGADRVDFGGCMVPVPKDGVTRQLPLEVLHRLKTAEKPTLLFLDDFGQAPIDAQNSTMPLFDEGYISPNVLIWGATNRPADRAGVTALSEPIRSRFQLAFGIPTPPSGGEVADKPDGAVMLGTWQDEVDGWIDWAFSVEAPAEVIAWHRSTTGRTLYQWKPHADPGVRMPDYRSWHTVIRLWNRGLRDLSTLAAAIGKPAAAEFTAFAALADRVPTPDQVRMDPNHAPVPKEPSAMYLIVSMLTASAQPADAGPFVTYLSRLPRLFGALLGRDLYRKLGMKLSGQPAWQKWFSENQQLFTQ